MFIVIIGSFAGILGWRAYNESLIIDTSPNINTHEYLPFDENSKIATLEKEASLKFQISDDLPVLDGAAAVFPVYSAFINAVYPDTVKLYDDVFDYNNTVTGYKRLAEKSTDIFFGAQPSKEQVDYAAKNGTEFVYTLIGSDAFVFFVHKNNPIDNLTTEQIKKIYSGEITNWKELGGKDELIAAFQRNEGSGSQSMLIRFMDGTPIMEPPTEQRNDLMSGIIEDVARYKSKSGSIGFSFRYYVEGIIKNPDIKLLSIDGIAPTIENIKSKAYPITAPLYAVTYKDNHNKNVARLLEWVLSDEGQELIEKTGYVSVK
ncbi:MAG: substrate-binding domain-containing protein [Clostridia bacterium]|nr:substrate-binding domain-containing protein [Clostridia bacterium]